MCIFFNVNIKSSLILLHVFQLLVKLPLVIEHFFSLNQQNKSPASKVKLKQASNCKKVFKVAKYAHANKTEECITSQKLGSCNFR